MNSFRIKGGKDKIIRNFSTRMNGRAFNESTIEAAWQKGTPEEGLASFRKDLFGASRQIQIYGKQEKWGCEIYHVTPVSKGGTDDLRNLRPLQWENNKRKGDNYPDWDGKTRSYNKYQSIRRIILPGVRYQKNKLA